MGRRRRWKRRRRLSAARRSPRALRVAPRRHRSRHRRHGSPSRSPCPWQPRFPSLRATAPSPPRASSPPARALAHNDSEHDAATELLDWPTLASLRVGLVTSLARPRRVHALLARRGVAPVVSLAARRSRAPKRRAPRACARPRVDLWLTDRQVRASSPRALRRPRRPSRDPRFALELAPAGARGALRPHFPTRCVTFENPLISAKFRVLRAGRDGVRDGALTLRDARDYADCEPRIPSRQALMAQSKPRSKLVLRDLCVEART